MDGLLAIVQQWLADTTVTAPEWQVKHRGHCTVYTGTFAIYNTTGQLLWQVHGEIVEWPGLPTEVYVYDPPPKLKRHPRGPCLQLVRPGSSWFRLHWEKPARDFDESRAYVEQLLSEALFSI